MYCHTRMSPIVLVLLWTLCISGGTDGRNSENDKLLTSGRNVSLPSQPPTNYNIRPGATNQFSSLSPQHNSLKLTTTNKIGESETKPKTTSRSKLWSPYSTLVSLSLMDEGIENEDDVRRVGSTAATTFAFGKSTSKLKGKSGSGGDETQPANDAQSPLKLPIISSIRHYRSRKSFVRTRKTLESVQTSTNLESSAPSAQPSQGDGTDLEEGEQGDEPFSYDSMSTTDAKTGNRRLTTISHGTLVKATTGSGQNSSISFQTDGEKVYGIPYFISTKPEEVGNTSTKTQKIDKFLLRKHFLSSKNTSRSSSSGSTRADSEASSVQEENSETYLRSTDLKYGVAVLSPTLDNRNTLLEKDSATSGSVVGSSKKPRQEQISPSKPTRKPKGSGGTGKRSREKSGTKKPQYANENIVPEDKVVGGRIPSLSYNSTSSSSPQPPTRRRQGGEKIKVSGADPQHGAFRKVKEKTRKISRLPDVRDKPSNYKTNYDTTDAHSADIDHGDSVGTGYLQNEDQNNPGYKNGGLGGKEMEDYFPKIPDPELEGDQTHHSVGDGDVTFFEENEENVHNPNHHPDDAYEGLDLDAIITSSINAPPDPEDEKPGSDIVTVFLRIVESQHTLGANCTRGTDFNLGEGVVDRYAQERFRLQAELTANRANMLTRFWKYAERKSLEDEYLLHAMVISLIEFDEDIFAGGNCYDAYQYKNYPLFCAYGYRELDGSIIVKDLSREYNYLSNTSEWFFKARNDADRIIKNFSQFSRGSHRFRRNESNLVEEEILNVTYEDGKWSKPYFDCGGGNIWMITYTIPFFGYNGTYYFKGTSGIDIDLRRVDIDQCPLPANSTELNIFAASDKCKKATTKCVPIKGLGFRRGSYRCECKNGFYFPNVSSPFKYFNGTLLEEEYEKKFTGTWENETSVYDTEGLFECFPCPYGCDTCMDDRPCVVSLNWLMRTAILILQSAIIAMLPIVGLFTWKYQNVKVVRAASPVLLRFIVLGAFFIYCTILVMYPSPSVITCTIRVWLREIGFSLAYGALMLKTWRISVIFRVRSAKAIKITDLDLMKRLGVIVGTFTSLLVIRTLVAPPVAIVSYTADELKAWLCKSDWWDHSFTIMELCFLVWGIRLCIVVRKAPSEFNESKFISLAIYNEFLLSLFLNISMLFLQSPANPDLLYIIFFCHVQLTMTLLLCLIFGSKAYIVFRGEGKEGSDETRVPTSKFIKSRTGNTTKQTSAHNSTGLHSSTTSTSHDPNLNSRLSEDVQEEFRRLYFQLEELKERNMRQGNRHLVAKITAMQEAADNILCTSAQINGQQSGSGTSPNIKGKSGVLSDISEEENPSLSQSTVQTVEATGIPGRGEKTGVEFQVDDHRSKTTSSSDKTHEQDVDVTDGKLKGRNQVEKRKKEERVQFKNLELQDTNLDEVDSDEDQKGLEVEGVTSDLVADDSKSDITQDCINEDGKEKSRTNASEACENIPMQSLRKRKHKQQQNQESSNPSASGTPSSAEMNSSIEIGKQGKTGGEKSQNQNHTGGPNSKLVLDLDDKSRFTEEITV